MSMTHDNDGNAVLSTLNDAGLVLVGANYRTLAIEVRERLSLCGVDVPYALRALRAEPKVREVVFLSTCNRAEIYALIDNTEPEVLLEFLYRQHRLPKEKLRKGLYILTNEDACAHLFQVAAGLDSLVLGEPQILKQVKDAFQQALQEDACGAVLSQLFRHAIRVGKRVRTETRISEGAISIPHAAVHFAERTLDNLSNCNVLLIGIGEMGMLTLKLLRKRGATKIVIANRSFERARALADEFGARAVSLSELSTCIANADVVISCTAAPNHVIDYDTIQQVMSMRSERPLLIIDLAVPRDVAPEVGKLRNVTLVNVDGLEVVVQQHRQQRQWEARRAEGIVTEEVEAFWRWWRARRVEPIIVGLLQRAEQIRRRTLSEFNGRFEQLSERDRELLEMLTRRLTKRLLHPTLEQIKQFASEVEDADLIELCARLLGAKSK